MIKIIHTFATMDTGKNITAYMDNCGATLKEIAGKAGIPYVSILKMKKNNQYTSSTIDKICEALQISPLELISTEDDRAKFFLSKSEELKKNFPGFVDEIFTK